MSFSVVSLLFCSVAESAKRAQEISVSLAQLPAHAHAERSRLQTFRACALQAVDPESAQSAAMSAWSEAQQAGDDTAIAWALLARSVPPSCESRDERRADCREALQIAQKSEDRELIAGALFLLLAELVEGGALTELDRLLAPGGALLSTAPWLEDEGTTAWFRCLRATLDGQVGRAENIAQAGLTSVQRDSVSTRSSVWLGQLLVARWMQGRISEVESVARKGRQESSNEVVWTVLLAWAWAQQGRRIAAQAILETIPQVGELDRNRDWLATMSVLALISAELGLADIARGLYAELLPVRERLITMSFGSICLGTVHVPLARLSALLGDSEQAVGHYREAVALTAKMGAHPWLAEAQNGLAELLIQRGDSASVDEAQALATEAHATARSLQLHRFEELAAALLASIRKHRERAASLIDIPGEHTKPSIRVLGTFEAISTSGEVVRWQSKKARELLKILIARRGAPLTRERLIDLLWPDEQIDRLYNRLAVATSTVRRALDPSGDFPPNSFVETRGDLIRLNARLIDIDAERFLGDVHKALEYAFDATERISLLITALEAFAGQLFIDEPDAPWAIHYRREVHDKFLEASYALAVAAGEKGDHLARVDAYRRILRFDVYEQRAHEGLIQALTALGAHGQAVEAEVEYKQRMRELGIELRQGLSDKRWIWPSGH